MPEFSIAEQMDPGASRSDALGCSPAKPLPPVLASLSPTDGLYPDRMLNNTPVSNYHSRDTEGA